MPDSSSLFLSVIIPAFNEEALAQTLHAVCGYLRTQSYTWEVAVVDDGSTDATSQLVERASSVERRIRMLHYPKNRGKGYAVQYGMLRTTGMYRLFMDADNSTSIDHVAQFLLLVGHGTDVFIGSRAVPEAQVLVHQPRWKEWLGKLGNRWIRFWAVPGIQDTQAGFKMFTAKAAESIFSSLTISGWAFDVEVLAIARSRGYKIAEMPVRWVNDAQSKVTWRAYLQVLKDVVKIRFNLWKGMYRAP